MDELLGNQLLQLISEQGGNKNSPSRPKADVPEGKAKTSTSMVLYEGGNSGRLGGKYLPIMQKDKLQSPEEQNERYAIRKGYARAQELRNQKGFGKRKVDESTPDESTADE